MGKSQETWNKREKEKKRLKKREDKQKRKEARQENAGGSSLEDMIAYVDADGNITDTPPDPTKKKTEIKAEDIVIGIPPKGEEEETINEGTVSFFDHSKGFGFIKVKDSNESLFTHMKSNIDEITEGNRVTFDVASGEKGPIAINVKILK